MRNNGHFEGFYYEIKYRHIGQEYGGIKGNHLQEMQLADDKGWVARYERGKWTIAPERPEEQSACQKIIAKYI